MHDLITAAAGSDWSYGGAIFTFVFPELLFIFVAGALYVAYTMPHMVPGYRQQPVRPNLTARPATATPGVAIPGQGGQAAAGPADGEQPGTAGSGDSGATGGQAS